MEEEKRGGVIGKIIIVIVIVAVAAAAFWFFRKNTRPTNYVVDATKYQAVFLTNGQTYFGKVTNEEKAYVALSDVYYLILKKPLQSQSKEGDDATQDIVKPEYSLIKLGKEMHGPTSMSINKDQILFIENLADDSKVVSAIKSQK